MFAEPPSMRLHVLSDLHLEHRRDWRALVDQIPSDLGDVLVLAGDILCLAAEEDSAEMLGRLRSKARQVLYVMGNHEHYRSELQAARAVAADLCARSGVRLLDETALVVDGRRFLGCTLWFSFDDQAHAFRHLLTDFRLIAGLDPAVYEENRRARAFLDDNIRAGDIVVTHHLPARAGVAPHFKREPYVHLTPFFANQCETLVEDKQAALWIHGHMHVPSDWRLGETRIVCNPIGYPGDRGAGRLDYVVDV
jgi:predicted phosphodiesterase